MSQDDHQHPQNQTRPLLLVSNDDGIDSFFLRALVDALLERYEVIVVAPAHQQSWVGRAMTRSGSLTVRRVNDWSCDVWSVDGRPADCVNIGLHHLCETPPVAIISGMNLGFNTTLALTLSSGTVGAATEGALAGLPAFAFSLEIPHTDFLDVSQAHGHRTEEGNRLTRIAATHALKLTSDLLLKPHRPYTVHNINFPAYVTPTSPVRQTTQAIGHMPSLFTQVSEDPECYQFTFSKTWTYTHNPPHSDLNTIRNNEISHTMIDWSTLSPPHQAEPSSS